jgi:hypothetical protein
MWARKSFMFTEDLHDKKLWQYVADLKAQSMYGFFLDQLIQANGFIRKEFRYVEDKTGQTYIGLIVFETKDDLDLYMNRDEIKSIYEYAKIIGAQQGVEFEISDVELDQSGSNKSPMSGDNINVNVSLGTRT